MRDEQINFLVTTSILERGVTFPEIDVLVLGADDAVFSTAALVQIAGRAGRSVSRPTGDVLFWVGSAAKNVTGAQQQIKFVNRKGRRLQR
jgi:competence protein ComFA